MSITRDELWSEVFGSGYEAVVDEWLVAERFIDGDWETPGTVQLVVEDPEEDGHITKAIDADDLYRAYEIAVERGYNHCGSPINDQDFDACVGDIILQIAVYDEVVYG